ncbi:MAG: gliding motility-associated C-terminal domain-containing protein, partial [Flavobacterium sp.]|nr:gliding motility-associated C-terminal domain-containing protein [Flavobacterium sp.]
KFYVRAICSPTDKSDVSDPATANTQLVPPACGGTFTDPGGANANYANNANVTTTITPTPGQLVTITFTQFDLESNFDFLKIYDGCDVNAPLLGTYTGLTFPPQTTATNASGCLTFVFTSDGSVTHAGFVASVTCSPPPTCPKPSALTATNVTQTTALLGWTDIGTPPPTQWQVLVLPLGTPAPLPNDNPTTGIYNAPSNPILITGLTAGTQYTFYVRAICSPTDTSFWSIGFNFNTLPGNDECSGAVFVPVNSSSTCGQTVQGTVSGATASSVPLNAPCVGTPDDDVWFQFVASNPYLNVSLSAVTGTSFNLGLNFAVYSGSCGNLTQYFCSGTGLNSGTLNNLIVGQTYYIRVYSNANTPQTISFNLCISTPSTCDNSSSVCTTTGVGYTNTTGVTSLGTIGCLFTTPNPTYFTIQVLTSGPINYLLTQSTTQGGPANLDVDYVAWGPFTSQNEACTAISSGAANLTGLTTGCSYSAAPTENFNIPNAIAGQYYIILITNYSNNPGYISLTQANASTLGSGSTLCCPDAKFAYNPTSYCKNGGSNPVAVINIGSVAGTFTASPAGLVFVSTATGEVNLALSAPGNYIVTNTVLPIGGGCTQTKTFSYTINISDANNTSTTISYPNSSYCGLDNATYTPIVSGGTGTGNTSNGIFSSLPLGLNINPTTGAIQSNLSSSGVYTVSYSLSSIGACPSYTATTTVTINDAVVPTFNTIPSFCSGSTAPVLPTTSLNGISGTWSPSIVSNTASGNYTFIPNSGQCATNKTIFITVQNCGFGTYATAVWLTNCSTSNFFNTTGSGANLIGPASNIFPNSNLGTYVQNSNSLILRGAEVKTFKNPASNVCSSNLYFRVYPQAGTPGAFTSLNLPFFDNCTGTTFPTGGACQPGDQKWQNVLNDSQLPYNLTTYPPGNYVLEVYYDVSGSNTSTTLCNDTILVNNGGANFISTFSIQSTPAYSSTNPTTCNATNGTITISGLALNTVYSLSYDDDTVANGPQNLTSNSSGEIIISGLNAGTYSNFTLSINGCIYTNSTPIVLVNPQYTPTFIAVAPICSGDTLSPLPTSSTNSTPISGTWSPALNNTATTTYTFTPDGGQCATTAILTLTVNPTVTPTFNAVAPICSGDTLNPLPTSSTNSTPITGTWSPALNNTATTTYTFTPDAGQCATTANLTITIIPNVTPTFNAVAPICSGDTLSPLPTSSTNSTPITGTWSPALNNTATTTYTFTPDAGQCATTANLTITVVPNVTPTFNAVAPICSGDTLSPLPTSSTNATPITGTWSPALNNTATTTYTFTPNPGQCASITTLTIFVNPKVTPTFNVYAPLCTGDIPPVLPSTSTNSTPISGTWNPATVSNTASGTYTFTPNAGQCAIATTISIVVQSDFDFEVKGDCMNNNFILEVKALTSNLDLNTASYEWQNANGVSIGTNNPTFNATNYITSNSLGNSLPVTLNVKVTNGGCSKIHPYTIQSIFCDIQKGISPNGDIKNDFFDLSGFGVQKLSIFNRYGMKAYSKNDYTKEWFGQSDAGEELPDGTYYYVIEFKSGADTKTGWIYINRQNN